MFLATLKESIATLQGIGTKSLRAFGRLGIESCCDLLLHRPRTYIDRTIIRPLNQWNEGEVNTIALVEEHSYIFRGRTRTLKVIISDDTGRAALLCYGRNFLSRSLSIGTRIRIAGTFKYQYKEIQTASFDFLPIHKKNTNENNENKKNAQELALFSAWLPIYPATQGLSQLAIRNAVQQALDRHSGTLDNEVPEKILEETELPPFRVALTHIHFPPTSHELTLARRSLALQELFIFQIGLLQPHSKQIHASSAPEKRSPTHIAAPPDRWHQHTFESIERDGGAHSPARSLTADRSAADLLTQFIASLPFTLTADQKQAIDTFTHEITSEFPMARLLQGDVGCGKTLVALASALVTIGNGGQVAFMVPTELLLRQHAQNARRLFRDIGIRIDTLLGNQSAKKRAAIIQDLQSGAVDLVIGTHALLTAQAQFHNLRLVIIDEQQRFGVMQRRSLIEKGEQVDILLTTATPIPQTLALTLFGNLKITTIKTMPPGRLPIRTHLTKYGNEGRVYAHIARELEKKHQAYFIYPRISQSDDSTLRDAETMYEHLRTIFPTRRLGLLHAKMRDEEQYHQMEQFQRGEIDILVATSIVEVGVDVPNATCMIVEQAEHFGLATLHQMRGRVGRGAAQSYCFFIYDPSLNDIGKRRLRELLSHSDGFALAEVDLQLRGAGSLSGQRQSGVIDLRFALFPDDLELLQHARFAAQNILSDDPTLSTLHHQWIHTILENLPND